MTKREAIKLFNQALPLVESDSVRKWASNQRDVWVRFIPQFDLSAWERPELGIATRIVSEAIGL